LIDGLGKLSEKLRRNIGAYFKDYRAMFVVVPRLPVGSQDFPGQRKGLGPLLGQQWLGLALLIANKFSP
jgi:hypothetical protein